MENYSYTESDSSPRSRDIDFENPPPPSEDNSNSNYRVKFMCSYGGKITPRPHDNHLSYVGGDTKILAVDRTVKFSGLIAKISSLCEADICFKYQLPGEDLDALISVTNDDDLQHMMHEYDRLNRASSPKPARLRLFLFPASGSNSSFFTPAQSFGSNASEKDRFVEALNSGPVQPPEMAAATGMTNNNVDFLFGLEKGIPPPPVVAKHEIITDPVFNQPEVRVPAMYRRKGEENVNGEYYGQQKSTENVTPPTLPGQVNNGFWPEKQIHGGVYPPAATNQQMYMIQAPSNMYHAAAPMAARPPVTGPVGQGYYAVQRMPPAPTEFYREQQPVYTQQQQQQQLQSTTMQPTLQQQLPAGYTQVAAYDGGAMGRQVYYTAQGGVVVAQPQPPTAAQYQAAMVAGNFNQDGGNVVPAKVTQQAAV